jgi:tRNA/tmRNA/rRNA uracil-C5-methylase (TrmA/RlmC/RlmD family)
MEASLPHTNVFPTRCESTAKKGRQPLRFGQDHKQAVSERVGGLTFRFLAGDFFQNNPHVVPLLVDYVISRARSAGARFLVDAYCGGGLFCLSASREFQVRAEGGRLVARVHSAALGEGSRGA